MQALLSRLCLHMVQMRFLSIFIVLFPGPGPCVSLAALVPLCLGLELRAPGRGHQWDWGDAPERLGSGVHTHCCCIHVPQLLPSPRWHLFTAWGIILLRLAFLLLISRADVVFSLFCFYHPPLGLFSSTIKLPLALIHLSHR